MAAILEAANVEFFVVATGSIFRTAIGVHIAHRGRAVEAILEAEHPTNWYTSTDRHRCGVTPFAYLDASVWKRFALGQRVIETYSVLSSRDGLGVIGREHRCGLQFWSARPAQVEIDADAIEPAPSSAADAHVGDETIRHGDGDSSPERHNGASDGGSLPSDRITAPRRNPFVRVMAYERALSGSTIVAGRRFPTAPEFDWLLSADTCPFPIDLVYTWVDGDDPNWRLRRERAANGTSTVSSDGGTAERFRSFDELRYSLRSAWQYVPYVRRIYIVTDGQTPSWLDPNHSRIRVVDHRDIFSDPTALPTFNSHAIESQLHHISGLADHYLYLNDDVFFGRLSNWTTYFDRSGNSRFFPSKARFGFGEPSENDTSVDHAGKNLQALLFKATGAAPYTKIKHTPHPQQRDLLRELEHRFPDAYKATMRARFRSATDVSFAVALHHRYGEAVGRAHAGKIDYQYLNLAADNLPDRLNRLVGSAFDTLCLNDGALQEDASEGVRRLVESFLAERFPYRAPWEIDGGRAKTVETHEDDFDRLLRWKPTVDDRSVPSVSLR